MALLAFQNGQFDPGAIFLCLGIVSLILLQYHLLQKTFKHLERFTLLIADFLCVLSLVVLYRLYPEVALKQFIWIAIGNVMMVIALLVIRKIYNFGRLNWVFMILNGWTAGQYPFICAYHRGRERTGSISGPFLSSPANLQKSCLLL